MCHSIVIPAGVRIRTNKQQLFCTLAGGNASKGSIQLSGICLPTFDKNCVIEGHNFEVFEGDCAYDVILGGDFLAKIGMNLKYDDLIVEWLGNTIPMETMNRSTFAASQVDGYLSQLEEEDMGFEVCSYLTSPMFDAKYEKMNIDDVISDNCKHLTRNQQQDLQGLLMKYKKLFEGMLG